MNDRVHVQIDDGIARVTLNRPDKMNALDMAMFRAIDAAARKLRRQRGLRAVILAGAGSDFCSGLDVKSATANPWNVVSLMWKWLPWRPNLVQRVAVRWRRLKVPVIAAIRGRCWGGGLQIALGADFRIATPDASLSVMETRWGLIPDMGGTLALRELLGRDQALRLAMTGEVLDGNRALSLGLVTALDPDPDQAASALASALADRSPDAVNAIKKLYRKSWRGHDGIALARESLYQWPILMGDNRKIAARRQAGDNLPYRD